MAIQQITRVLRLPKHACTRREFNVLIALADTANADGGGIFCGTKALARKARVGERVVKLALKKLRERGWLEAVRPGGGRSANGNPKRTIWRLTIPNLQEMPRPAANPQTDNNLRSFPQGFPQFVHNGDQTITVNGDRTIPVNGDRTCTQAAAQTTADSTAWPVENEPIRPVRTRPIEITRPEGGLPLEKDTDHEAERKARLELLERVRGTVLAAATPSRRELRRRREGSG